MTNLVPAASGTTLIDRNGNVLAVIVAYQYISGNMAFPVFTIARGGIANDEAIYDPTLEGVSHPASQRFFETVDNWTTFAGEEEWEAAAVEAAEQAAPQPVRRESATVHPTTTQAQRDAATKAIAAEALADAKKRIAAAKATPGSPLKFGNKTFASKSFWYWAEANAVFEIEPDSALPDDKRAVKVKRDEFAAYKRDGATKIDPHAGVVEEAPTADVDEDEDDVV